MTARELLDVLDRPLTGFEHGRESGPERHVANDGQPEPARLVHDRGVDGRREPAVDLHEVEAERAVLAHGAARVLRGPHDPPPRESRTAAVEMRTARDDPWSRQLTARHALAQLHVSLESPHVAKRRHAAGQERLERGPAVEVDVHVGQPRHDPAAAAVDPPRPARNLHLRHRPDRDDPISSQQDRLMREHPLPVHRQDRDVEEHDGRLGRRAPRGEGRERQCGTRQPPKRPQRAAAADCESACSRAVRT